MATKTKPRAEPALEPTRRPILIYVFRPDDLQGYVCARARTFFANLAFVNRRPVCYQMAAINQLAKHHAQKYYR